MMLPPAAVVTDIEGTTTPIAFVHAVMFPYARANLPAFLASHKDTPEVAALLGEVRAMAPGVPELETLLAWMDADAKITPLKTLQGLIWRQGFASGALRGELYADVAPALKRWRAGGVRLYVYSSGSEAAQKQLFGHTAAGDLTGLFSGFFDTRVGGKRDAPSYASIATAVGVPSPEMLFLSDIAEELDAAAKAGWRTCQLLRPQDGTKPCASHPHAADFAGVVRQFRLPG